MIVGLLPMTTVAEWLGKRPEEMARVVAEDRLPAINVPTASKQVRKVSVMALHRWVKKRSVNEAPTLEELEEELQRASERIAARVQAKRERKGRRNTECSRPLTPDALPPQ
jgi:hypothetical protein